MDVIILFLPNKQQKICDSLTLLKARFSKKHSILVVKFISRDIQRPFKRKEEFKKILTKFIMRLEV